MHTHIWFFEEVSATIVPHRSDENNNFSLHTCNCHDCHKFVCFSLFLKSSHIHITHTQTFFFLHNNNLSLSWGPMSRVHFGFLHSLSRAAAPVGRRRKTSRRANRIPQHANQLEINANPRFARSTRLFLLSLDDDDDESENIL